MIALFLCNKMLNASQYVHGKHEISSFIHISTKITCFFNAFIVHFPKEKFFEVMFASPVHKPWNESHFRYV